jgi:hypothetical protein
MLEAVKKVRHRSDGGQNHSMAVLAGNCEIPRDQELIVLAFALESALHTNYRNQHGACIPVSPPGKMGASLKGVFTTRTCATGRVIVEGHRYFSGRRLTSRLVKVQI